MAGNLFTSALNSYNLVLFSQPQFQFYVATKNESPELFEGKYS